MLKENVRWEAQRQGHGRFLSRFKDFWPLHTEVQFDRRYPTAICVVELHREVVGAINLCGVDQDPYGQHRGERRWELRPVQSRDSATQYVQQSLPHRRGIAQQCAIDAQRGPP